MKQQSLGEFEELVLLMVAALHDEAYGVVILEGRKTRQESEHQRGSRSLKAHRRQRLCQITVWRHHRRSWWQAQKILCCDRIRKKNA